MVLQYTRQTGSQIDLSLFSNADLLKFQISTATLPDSNRHLEEIISKESSTHRSRPLIFQRGDTGQKFNIISSRLEMSGSSRTPTTYPWLSHYEAGLFTLQRPTILQDSPPNSSSPQQCITYFPSSLPYPSPAPFPFRNMTFRQPQILSPVWALEDNIHRHGLCSKSSPPPPIPQQQRHPLITHPNYILLKPLLSPNLLGFSSPHLTRTHTSPIPPLSYPKTPNMALAVELGGTDHGLGKIEKLSIGTGRPPQHR